MLLSQNSLGVLLKQEAPLLVSNTQVLFLRHRESFEQDFSLCVYLFVDRTAFFFFWERSGSETHRFEKDSSETHR